MHNFLFEQWQSFMQEASVNIAILQDVNVMRRISTILKTNERACAALGQPFITQLGRIYIDMLNVYKIYSQEISRQISTSGKLHYQLTCFGSINAMNNKYRTCCYTACKCKSHASCKGRFSQAN